MQVITFQRKTAEGFWEDYSCPHDTFDALKSDLVRTHACGEYRLYYLDEDGCLSLECFVVRETHGYECVSI